MKESHYAIIGAAALAVVSCVQPHPAAGLNAPNAGVPAAPARSAQYLALPGQAVQAVTTDTDAAFDQQVAAYTQGTAAPVGVPAAPVAPVAPGAPIDPMAPIMPVAPVAPGPVAADPMAPVAGVPAVAATMNYTIKFINNTPGRLFIEAQDAQGEIFPCGFISPQQSINSPKQNVAPIKGPITVVVRDPDKPDTPEIRRYKVDPPAGYAGKTIGIAIIPGGIYQTSLDGVVCYTSAPQPRPVVPAAPAAPDPAPVNPAPAL